MPARSCFPTKLSGSQSFALLLTAANTRHKHVLCDLNICTSTYLEQDVQAHHEAGLGCTPNESTGTGLGFIASSVLPFSCSLVLSTSVVGRCPSAATVQELIYSSSNAECALTSTPCGKPAGLCPALCRQLAQGAADHALSSGSALGCRPRPDTSYLDQSHVQHHCDQYITSTTTAPCTRRSQVRVITVLGSPS